MSIRISTSDNLHNQCYYPFLFLFTFSILLLHLPVLSSLSFNYPGFSNSQNLNTSRDASVIDGGILSLTRHKAEYTSLADSVGRAVYSQELHLWDNATGKVADFVTHFSFNISMILHFV